MNLTSNPFKKFYNTPVKIFKMSQSGAYTRAASYTELCDIVADVQPYNGGLAAKEYGLEAECQKRMFCDNDINLVAGNYAETGGKRYKIIYVEEWDNGAMAILQAVKI